MRIVVCNRIIQHLAGGRTLLDLAVLWTLISSSSFAVIIWEDVMDQGLHICYLLLKILSSYFFYIINFF